MQTEKICNHIVSWLKDYALKAKMEGFVIGISGGIDSAVTSALCARTSLKTLCVEMPIHQAESQVSRGKTHIENLKSGYKNVESALVDLTSVFDNLKEQLPPSANRALYELTLANTRARLRMTTLYYMGGTHQLLVAGTGNKVEDFGVGFYTKYGDGGVDLSPIADLMKSEVYALGKFLGVPQSILEAPPTDGLFGDDRTDEDQLGATYDELEWAMKTTEKQTDPTNFTKRQEEVFAIYTRLHKINQHKMNPIPVCTVPEEWKR